MQGGLAELAQQCEELKVLLQTQTENKEAALSQLQTLILAHDELHVVADQRLEEGVALLSQVDALVVERGELQGQLQSQAQESELELVEARRQIDIERTDYKSLQSQLNHVLEIRDEHAALAAQRQGELLQQAKEQLHLEKSKAALEVRQLELEQLLSDQTARETGLIERLSAQIQSLATREVAVPGVFEELFKKQSDDLVRVRRHLETAIKNNSANAVRQLQSFVGMQEYFATGVLPAFNSESHSWPVSADFALCLMQRVVLEQYDLVIEFGSGMSTVILAKTLALRAERDPSAKTQFISFDHLDSYYQQTLGYLKQSGVDSLVQLTLAPLQEWQAADGQIYPYYSCQKALAHLAKQRSASKKRILVIVDGPPAATGPRARYPAGPIVMQYFPDAHIDFLMDDFIRQDEKEVAKQWQRDVKAAGLLSAVRNFKFEKDACLITVHPKDSK